MIIHLEDFLRKTKNDMKSSFLPVPIGVDLQGKRITGDITKFPHVLITGTTGSGKSMLLHTWICTLLKRHTPNEVRMILIDPKRVELLQYNGISHLLSPVIVDIKKVISVFGWVQEEMEIRYRKFAQSGVKDIGEYNLKNKKIPLSYIIIIVDEFSDLMAYAPVEFEDIVFKFVVMARAIGIHMILSTSRPSKDVFTTRMVGSILTRIAFNLSTSAQSRWIIGYDGAEKLSGKGEMLYYPSDLSKPIRIQGTYISEQDVEKVIEQTDKIRIDFTNPS